MKFRVCWLLSLLLALPLVSKAAPANLFRQQIDSLSQQQQLTETHQQVLLEQLSQLQQYSMQAPAVRVQQVNDDLLAKESLDLAVARAELASLGQQLSDTRHELLVDEDKIKRLQQRIQETRFASLQGSDDTQELTFLQAELGFARSVYKLRSHSYDTLRASRQIAAEIVRLQIDRYDRIEKLYHPHQNKVRQKHLSTLAATVEKQKQGYLAQLSVVNKKLAGMEQNIDSGAYLELLTERFVIQNRSRLIDQQLQLVDINDQVEDLRPFTRERFSMGTLSQAYRRSSRIRAELRQVNQHIENSLQLISQHRDIMQRSMEQALVSASAFTKVADNLKTLTAGYRSHLVRIEHLNHRVKEYRELLQQRLRHAISLRQGLPGFDWHGWWLLAAKLTDIPRSLAYYAEAIEEHVALSWGASSTFKGSSLALSLLLGWLAGLFAWLRLGRFSQFLRDNRERASFNLLFGITELLRGNWFSLLATATFVVLITFSHTPWVISRPFVLLLVIWLSYRLLIGCANLLLVNNMNDASSNDVVLYNRLKWVFRVSALFTTLMVVTHTLPVAVEIRELLNRVFMLYLLVLSFFFFKGRRSVSYLLEPYLKRRRAYVRNSISLVLFFLPLTLLTTAFVGLIGYVSLAWKLSFYQLVFVGVFASYILIRGLFVDLMVYTSAKLIGKFQHGWLWSAAFLKPFDKLFRLGLFVLAWLLLFMFYGWDQHSKVLEEFNYILHYPVFAIGKSEVTPFGVLALVFMFAGIFWAGRWSREFTFRWLFKARDPGLRNSMAVFTQYVTVIIGSLIALKVLGVDFTGLTFILTGLAFGAGFGLRDFAKDFASGLMLLAERPARKGDYVSLGGIEGEVIRIGIRAMTVMTWDHFEVVVPNSEIFSKAFTNWTHQDYIVRTVIRVRVNRADDPAHVQKLILRVLEKVEAVVEDPAPQVYMKEIDDSLLEFDVRYFINLQENQSRPAVRSQVLFAIWECFKAHGIKPPYPQQDLHVQSLPEKA